MYINRVLSVTADQWNVVKVDISKLDSSHEKQSFNGRTRMLAEADSTIDHEFSSSGGHPSGGCRLSHFMHTFSLISLLCYRKMYRIIVASPRKPFNTAALPLFVLYFETSLSDVLACVRDRHNKNFR